MPPVVHLFLGTIRIDGVFPMRQRQALKSKPDRRFRFSLRLEFYLVNRPTKVQISCKCILVSKMVTLACQFRPGLPLRLVAGEERSSLQAPHLLQLPAIRLASSTTMQQYICPDFMLESLLLHKILSA